MSTPHSICIKDENGGEQTFIFNQKGEMEETEIKSKFIQIFSASVGSLMCVCFGIMLGWPSPTYPKLLGITSPVPITLDQSALIAGFLMIGNLFATLISTWSYLGTKYGIVIGAFAKMNKVLNLSGANDPDPQTGLTPKEKHLVENSWSLVRTDLRGNGVDLFLIFFKEFPEHQSNFPFRDVPYSELSTNSKLKAHAVTVMYSVTSIVDHLNDNDVLITLLQKNGTSHGQRGISQQAYWDLKKCIIMLLKTKLKTHFTKETEEAWEKTLTVAFTVAIKNL